MPLLRAALREVDSGSSGQSKNVILESNTLLQFLKPSLYLMVVHPAKADFKESAQLQIDRASALVLREHLPPNAEAADAVRWTGVPLQLLRTKPQFLQREGEPLPGGVSEAVRQTLGAYSHVPSIKPRT
jgi:hypothetical protein